MRVAAVKIIYRPEDILPARHYTCHRSSAISARFDFFRLVSSIPTEHSAVIRCESAISRTQVTYVLCGVEKKVRSAVNSNRVMKIPYVEHVSRFCMVIFQVNVCTEDVTQVEHCSLMRNTRLVFSHVMTVSLHGSSTDNAHIHPLLFGVWSC